MVSIENLSVEFGVKPLFTDANYVINRHERIALVGKNGAGKSTMLKIIAGIQQPTRGRVSKPKGMTIGYLPQVMILSDSMTVRQETEKAFASTIALEERLTEMNKELETRTDYESQSYADLIDNMTELNEQLTVIQSQNRDAEIERTLMGLGFERSDLDRPTSEFSGGWRMRIELAKILLQHPDLLLLDEPTNHLDIESIQWLEKFLVQNSTTLLLISHDRAFLDNVTTRTIEITCGTIHDYNVNYSKYVVLHAERIEQQRHAYENQQKMIQETKDFIERFRYQATKAIQVQSRIKQLEKVVPIEIDEVDNSRLNLKFPPAPRSGDYPVICQDVRKIYPKTHVSDKPHNGDEDGHLVFDHVELTINRGEKVAFVGRNGEGKSTLVKCIMDQIPYDGTLKIGHGVKIGYFAQNQAQLLDEEISVFDTIDRVAVGDIRTKIRDILGAFMFGGEAIDKPVKVLSGGERSRLAMIRLLLEPVNLLILDEPTNHLDISSKQVLKDAINAFEGTVIVVSHDRDFLDGLVSKVYEFGQGRVREHFGGIYDYLQKKSIDSLQELEKKKTGGPTPSLPHREGEIKVTSPNKNTVDPKVAAQSLAAQLTSNSLPLREGQGGSAPLTYEQQKALKAQVSKLEKQVKTIEDKMDKVQKKIDALEEQMATPEGCQNQQLYIDHGALKKELDDLSFEWLEASEELENLQK